MPIYEFRCNSCGELFEMFRAINDSDYGIRCPKCGGQDIKRIISTFSSNNSGSQSCSTSIPT